MDRKYLKTNTNQIYLFNFIEMWLFTYRKADGDGYNSVIIHKSNLDDAYYEFITSVEYRYIVSVIADVD